MASGRQHLLLRVVIYLVGSKTDDSSKIHPVGLRTFADPFVRWAEPGRMTQRQRDGGTDFELSGIARRTSFFALPMLALPTSPPAYVCAFSTQVAIQWFEPRSAERGQRFR
jgi:hypothetical protein